MTSREPADIAAIAAIAEHLTSRPSELDPLTAPRVDSVPPVMLPDALG